jgi:hypothetical protein
VDESLCLCSMFADCMKMMEQAHIACLLAIQCSSLLYVLSRKHTVSRMVSGKNKPWVKSHECDLASEAFFSQAWLLALLCLPVGE